MFTEDFGIFLDVLEDGKTAQENARKKALSYAQAAGRSVLSIDNALYLNGLSDDEQPGINTRHVPGRQGRATDEDLLSYYSEKIRQLGGNIDGHWEFAVCIADENGQIFETTIVSPRKFVSKPSKRILHGYPLESIQIDLRSGKYISEMTEDEQAVFWQAIIGNELCDFVSKPLTG